MLPRFWIPGMFSLSVVAVSLKPPQVIDLPSSKPLYDVISNASASRTSDNFSPFLAYPPSLSASNQSSSRLGRAMFQCDKSKFGVPSYDSCMEAYSWISRSMASVRYGDRSGSYTPDVPLPLRYSSSTWLLYHPTMMTWTFLSFDSLNDVGIR